MSSALMQVGRRVKSLIKNRNPRRILFSGGSVYTNSRGYFAQQALCALQHAPPVQQSAELDVAFVEPTSASAAMIINRYFIVSPVEVSFSPARMGEPALQATDSRGGGNGGRSERTGTSAEKTMKRRSPEAP